MRVIIRMGYVGSKVIIALSITFCYFTNLIGSSSSFSGEKCERGVNWFGLAFNSLKILHIFVRGQGSIPVPPTICVAKYDTSDEY
jgi:hypothetical protein